MSVIGCSDLSGLQVIGQPNSGPGLSIFDSSISTCYRTVSSSTTESSHRDSNDTKSCFSSETSTSPSSPQNSTSPRRTWTTSSDTSIDTSSTSKPSTSWTDSYNSSSSLGGSKSVNSSTTSVSSRGSTRSTDLSSGSRPCSSTEDNSKKYPSIIPTGCDTFCCMLTPLTNLSALESDTHPGMVEFIMTRRNSTITLQWEPFTAQIAATGIPYIVVNQSVGNLPKYTMQWPIRILYNHVDRLVYVELNPARKDHIRLYLSGSGLAQHVNSNGTIEPITMGDTIIVPGSAITYIVPR